MKMTSGNLLIFAFVIYSTLSSVVQSADDEEETIVVSMPAVQPAQDEYFCLATELDVDVTYVKKIETEVKMDLVHHVAVTFCEEMLSTEPLWNAERDMYKGVPYVGVEIGRRSRLKYMVVEVHYIGQTDGSAESAANVTLSVTRKAPRLRYQMYMLENSGYVPAHTEHGVFAESACAWTGPSVSAYGFVVHTHHYGVMVEGYVIRGGRWILLGSQRSGLSARRRFNVTGGPMTIREGDVLAARCLYINRGDHNVPFGHRSDWEMCNFLIDFAYDPVNSDKFNKPIACEEKSPQFTFCDHPETAGIC